MKYQIVLVLSVSEGHALESSNSMNEEHPRCQATEHKELLAMHSLPSQPLLKRKQDELLAAGWRDYVSQGSWPLEARAAYLSVADSTP